ncbi:MAG: hypothetical protein H7Y36_07230 [Armatimonadetes bacterium]|nr:hypothetical protein [Akkermansiaceae bacterium]
MDDLPIIRVGKKAGPVAKLGIASKEDMRTRSNEPHVGSLIEQEATTSEHGWDGSGATKKVPWGWVLLIGSAFAVGILWSLFQVRHADEKQDHLVQEAKTILEKEVMAERAAAHTIEKIEQSVRNFYDSRSIDELLRYVRHPDRVKPLMETYYSKEKLVPSRVDRILGYDPLTIEHNANFWMVTSELSPPQGEQLLVEVDADDVAKIDWETFVCFQPMDWDEFARNRPKGFTANFRVCVETDHYYSHDFADSEKYACFRLTTLDSEETLYGYVDRRSEMVHSMEKLIVENGNTVTPMILRLHVPKMVQSSRGVVIEKLIEARWLHVDPPDIESSPDVR